MYPPLQAVESNYLRRRTGANARWRHGPGRAIETCFETCERFREKGRTSVITRKGAIHMPCPLKTGGISPLPPRESLCRRVFLSIGESPRDAGTPPDGTLRTRLSVSMSFAGQRGSASL